MKTGKRLLQYALHYKKTILLALLMLTVAVTAELTGPYIAKKMIDTNILGIEKIWYETTASSEFSVQYQSRLFKREDHFAAGEEKGKEVRIFQVGTRYVFVDQPVAGSSGSKKFEDGTLVITGKDSEQRYPAQLLSKDEVFRFYQPEISAIMRLVMLYVVLVLIAAVLHYGQRYLLQASANRILQNMRRDVFRQIHRLPVKYFDSMAAGKIVSRVTNDTEAIREMFVTVLATFFSSGINIVGIYAAMFILNVRLALFTLLILPALVVWIVAYRHFAAKYNHVIRARLSDINGMINESILGMNIIRAFRRKRQMSEEFEALNNEYFKFRNKMQFLNSVTSFNLVNVLRNLVFVGLIWYFGGSYLQGVTVVTVGILYAFVDYINRLFQPVTDIVNQLANLEQARVASVRVFELMDQPGVDVDQGKMERYSGNVRFDGVNFAYDRDLVLKNISFEAKQGETVALVGHTGSGKSSILNLLFRFYDPQEGTITIDGKDTRSIPHQQLRQHMGIVLQDPFMFTGTIASNVGLDDPSIDRAKIEEALEKVGGTRMFLPLPKGYDEPVLEKGSTLSTGQRQLISFARALAFDPAILILDEATANIDTETEALIQQALDVVKQGRTTFIIAHRLSTIRGADQILVLHRGEIVERGDHDSLMAQKGRYYQMVQLQLMSRGADLAV